VISMLFWQEKRNVTKIMVCVRYCCCEYDTFSVYDNIVCLQIGVEPAAPAVFLESDDDPRAFANDLQYLQLQFDIIATQAQVCCENCYLFDVCGYINFYFLKD
jgi:hypothetical protein